MAGHSKWANIKHRKDRADKIKGKIFSRIMKEVISAVKQAGPDPKSNAKLRIAIQKAKDANVPNENLERNIKKASSADQGDYTEINYELYGYGGVGILVEIMTDNKNRISGDIRICTNKCGGTIATPGAVAYNFDRRGIIRARGLSEDRIFEVATLAGAEDVRAEGEVITSVEDFIAVKEALQTAGAKIEEAQLSYIPKVMVDCTEEDAQANIALIERLEGLDDVDAVHHNMN